MDTEAVQTSARLEVHEQQIQQLQSAVTEIKDSLSALIADRKDFRRVVLAWMKSQGTKTGDGSSDSEFSGEVFTYSHPKSVSAMDFGPKSACDRDLSGGFPSLADQLEAIIARSEERWSKHQQLMSTGPTDSRSLVFVSKLPNSSTPAASVRSKSDIIPVDRGNSADPLFSSTSSIPNSPSLLAQSKAIMSRSAENSRGHGLLMSHRVNGLLLDNLQGTLGSEPLVGHNGELKTVVDLDYPDPGQGVEKKKVVGLIFSDLDLCEKGNAPFDRGKSSLSHRPLIDTRLKFSATSHLWVVHGQPRPPEVVFGVQS
ncbi:hypothetical protein Hanom_Chr17g01548121 [Helianthus anomalus]